MKLWIFLRLRHAHSHILLSRHSVPTVAFNTTSGEYYLSDKLLTTVSDKRHCYLHEVVANECGFVESNRITENGYYEYVKIDGKKVKQFFPKFAIISPPNGILSPENGFAGGT